MSKRWRCILAGVIAISAVLFVHHVWFPGRAFDAALWHADLQLGSGVRQQMADRLVARGTLLGKKREEIVALLGEPPPTNYFGQWDLVYWLGMERGFIRIDSEWLVLRLNDDGRVAEACLATD